MLYRCSIILYSMLGEEEGWEGIEWENRERKWMRWLRDGIEERRERDGMGFVMSYSFMHVYVFRVEC